MLTVQNLPIFQHPIRLFQIVLEVGSHEREAEDDDFRLLVFEWGVGHVAGGHQGVDSHEIKGVDRVGGKRLGQTGLAAPEVSNHGMAGTGNKM